MYKKIINWIEFVCQFYTNSRIFFENSYVFVAQFYGWICDIRDIHKLVLFACLNLGKGSKPKGKGLKPHLLVLQNFCQHARFQKVESTMDKMT